MIDSSRLSPLRKRLGGRNLYLVGMMGSGKSATGPLLANQLEYSFVDADVALEAVTKKSIAEIFTDEGEEGFRSLERKVLKEIGQRHSLVVATGGGVVTESENWGILHQGIVVWIDPGREGLLARLLLDKTSRPLLKAQDPIAVLDQLIKKRQPLYKESDLHVLVGEESAQQVADQIVVKLIAKLNEMEGLDERQTIAK